MNITYFVNHYPKVSHTFIRREIQALESQGVTVNRIAIHHDEVTDETNPDYSEIAKTQYILKPSVMVLFTAFFSLLLNRFSKVMSGLFLCFKMIRLSDRSAIKNMIYFLEGLRLAVLCEDNGTEHIHAHFGTNSADVAMYCSHVTSIPFSFTVHGPEEFDRPLTINLTEKISRASLVFGITKFCKSQLQRWVNHEQWEKIKIIRCGLDASFFDADLPINTIDQKNINALFIGRLCEQKGPLILMKTLHQLRDKGIPLNVTFAGDGELRDAIEAYSKQNSLDDFVTITGWVNSAQIRQLLIDTDMMILPSFAEGLPVAIMEAMASMVPVISTRIAGIPELVKNNETGSVVSPGCSEELEQAIHELLALSEEDYGEMIRKGYTAVSTMHDAYIEAVKIEQYIKESLQ